MKVKIGKSGDGTVYWVSEEDKEDYAEERNAAVVEVTPQQLDAWQATHDAFCAMEEELEKLYNENY